MPCRYEDDDEEHLAWDELSKWLANAKKKLKGQGMLSSAAEASAIASHCAMASRLAPSRQPRLPRCIQTWYDSTGRGISLQTCNVQYRAYVHSCK